MSRIHSIVLAVLATLCGSAAYAQNVPGRPLPATLEESRSALRGLLKLCLEAKQRNQRIQELPSEIKEALKLYPTPVVRPVGADPNWIMNWSTDLSIGVRGSEVGSSCSVSMRPVKDFVAPFDSVAEARATGDFLVAQVPGLRERRFYPSGVMASGRKFVIDAEKSIPFYVAAYANGGIVAEVGAMPPFNPDWNLRFQPLESCVRQLHDQEKFAVSNYVRSKPMPGSSPASGYSFYWIQRFDSRLKPNQAIGENPSAPETCAFVDRGIDVKEAEKFLPSEIQGIALTLEKAKGGGTLIMARLADQTPVPP